MLLVSPKDELDSEMYVQGDAAKRGMSMVRPITRIRGSATLDLSSRNSDNGRFPATRSI